MQGSDCAYRIRVGDYRVIYEVFYAEPGTFEHWASERYGLYSCSARNGIARVEVHHAPWPLQRAEVMMEESSILSAAGIDPIRSDPVCHFSTGVHVVSFGKEEVSQSVPSPEEWSPERGG